MLRKENYVEKTKDNFRKGYNCCQCVILAYADYYGIDKDLALKLSCSFGGGIGRMKEVCGAVCAMAMIAGLETGNTDPSNKEAKQDNYEMTRYLMNEFRKENGSIYCNELTSLEEGDEGMTKVQERGGCYYKKKPCLEYVADAARIINKQFLD